VSGLQLAQASVKWVVGQLRLRCRDCELQLWRLASIVAERPQHDHLWLWS
jgi:hypothetical protein